MRPIRLASVVMLALFPSAAWSQGEPAGPEFRANTFTPNDQSWAQVAIDPPGNFVVVWASLNQDGYSWGIFGQRYTASGNAAGPEFRANTFVIDQQILPSVAVDSSGNFVVVWVSYPGEDGSDSGIFGQRYAGSGAPLGPQFRVNTYTTGFQMTPAVAADALGNFVVVWDTLDGSSGSVFGQRYAASGVPLGPEFRVNTYTTNAQSVGVVAADPSGNFVVVWNSVGQDGSSVGVFGQRYAASGVPLGPEFRVNTYTTSYQRGADVAADALGNIVVVWRSYGQDGSGYGTFGQRYDAAGSPLGPEFRVNTTTLGWQLASAVASDAAGNFVVVWDSGQDGSGYGVYGQRYASSGTPLGTEFRANSFTPGNQVAPAVAVDASGDFVVVWRSNLQDGSGYGIYGQRYNMIVPVELMQFRVE